jgi:hypothetical protein
MTHCMLSILSRIFGRPSFFNRLGLGRAPLVTPKRGGIGLGTLAALAAPFVIRRLMARRAMTPA